MTISFARPNERGFTLFEMMVVIVLVSVAAVVIGAGLSKGQQRIVDQRGLTSMVDALRAARVQAIVSGQPARASFDLRDRIIKAPKRPETRWPTNWEVRMQTAEELGSVFEFMPDGSSSGGNIVVRTLQGQWRIDVNWLTGVTRMQKLP